MVEVSTAGEDSKDVRNTVGKLFSQRFILQGLSRALVELSCDVAEFA